MPAKRQTPAGEADLRMVHENPWFLITRSELLMIEEGLNTLGKDLPATGSRSLGTIARIVSQVRERQS